MCIDEWNKKNSMLIKNILNDDHTNSDKLVDSLYKLIVIWLLKQENCIGIKYFQFIIKFIIVHYNIFIFIIFKNQSIGSKQINYAFLKFERFFP